MSAPAATNTLSYASSDPTRKSPVRFHPLRRLRIERWTMTHAVAATVMGCLAVAATFDAWADIYYLACRETEYSHIFLVPLVALWMVFARRLRIRHCKPIGTPLGLLIAAFGWVT